MNQVRIILEPHLEWEQWRMLAGGKLTWICGRERYPQVLYAFHVKPQQFETDPGPLDAGVP